MDSFNDIGFLSPDLNGWMTEARKDFEAGFDAAEAVNRLAMKVLYDLPAENMTAAHVLANACYGCALQSFQGVILLAKRGMLSDARTLARSCTESVIALAAAKVDQTMPEQMEESYDHHRLKLANALLEEKKQLGFADNSEMRQTIDDIRNKYGTNGPRQINWEAKARCGGVIALYTAAYRLTSGDGAHTTMRALDRHMTQDANGNLLGFKFCPDKSDIDSILFLACSAMVSALGLIKEWFDLSAHQGELSACIENWKQMRVGT